MDYSPPSATAVDFDLPSYTPPNWDAVNVALGSGGSSPGTDYTAPSATAVDFDLPSYTPPTWDAVNFVVLEETGGYKPPAADAVDFDLPSYTPPAWDSVDYTFGSGGTSSGTSYSAPSATAVDFDLPSYTAPAWDSVDFVLLADSSDGGGDDGGDDVTLPTSSGVDARVGVRYGRHQPHAAPNRVPWGRFRQFDTRYSIPSSAPDPRPHATRSPWGAFRTADSLDKAVYRGTIARALKEATRVPWNRLYARDTRYEAPWPRNISPAPSQWRMVYRYPPAKDTSQRWRYDHVDIYRRNVTARRSTYTPPAGDAVHFTPTDGYTPPPGDDVVFAGPTPRGNVRIGPRDALHPTPWNPSPPVKDEADRLPWGPMGRRDSRLYDIVFNQDDADPTEPPPLPPSQEVYRLMPSITAKRVSDGAAVTVNDCSITTDRDSWSWQLDATLARQADLDLVRPSGSGPVEIEITVNGRAWNFLIESHRRGRSYNSSSFRVSGRSPSALLAEPYSVPQTFTETSQKSAQQLAAQELNNTGFSLVWDMQDWNVPANTWSYDGLTPLQAIQRIAEAAGGVVFTQEAARTLIAEPYYPVSPWNWGSATMDAALTDDVTFQLDASWEPGPGFNAVYVSGKQGGVLVHVVQSDTNQSVEADQVVDELITERLAGRERGRRILSEAGDRESVGVTTPLLPAPEPPGLLEPGQLVEVTEPNATWRAQVQGVTITAKRSDATQVRQQLNLERYHGKS